MGTDFSIFEYNLKPILNYIDENKNNNEILLIEKNHILDLKEKKNNIYLQNNYNYLHKNYYQLYAFIRRHDDEINKINEYLDTIILIIDKSNN